MERRSRTLSIVTPVLNRVDTIARALASVTQLREQTSWEIEHVAVDGGSVDGTLEELRRFEDDVAVIARPDRSLYEAINRGIDHSSGVYVCLLNSDDEIIPVGLARLLAQIESDGFPEAVWGGAEVVSPREDSQRDDGEKVERFPGSVYGPLTPLSVTLGVPFINARIFRRDVFDKVGRFDNSFRIAGDRDFLIRALWQRIAAPTFDDPVYRYFVHEGSLTVRGGTARPETVEECLRIADAYAQNDAAPAAIRRAARLWGAWNRFLLETPEDTKPLPQLRKWSVWRDAPSRAALLGAVLAKGWLRGSTRLRSLQVG